MGFVQHWILKNLASPYLEAWEDIIFTNKTSFLVQTIYIELLFMKHMENFSNKNDIFI